MTTTRIRTLLPLALAGVIAGLAGCAPSLEEVLAEKGPATERVFDQLRALSQRAFELPPLAEDGLAIGDARIRLGGDDSNAVFLRSTDLASPETTRSDGVGGTHATGVAVCGEALRGEFHGVAAGMDSFLSHCGRAEYAFVLRTIDYSIAGMTGADTFEPGRYEGEVLLFRLADGAPLGGFRVASASSGEISVAVDEAGVALDTGERLDSDFEANAFAAIEAGLKAHVPGVLDGL
jgi:hypothetical protein